MLARYKIYRAPRPADDPLPNGVRHDVRWRTGHCLRPDRKDVEAYLKVPKVSAWKPFEQRYLAALEARLRADPAPFDELAKLTTHADVFIGRNCPTKGNPEVQHCHTVAALEFMRRHYPKLKVIVPGAGPGQPRG